VRFLKVHPSLAFVRDPFRLSIYKDVLVGYANYLPNARIHSLTVYHIQVGNVESMQGSYQFYVLGRNSRKVAGRCDWRLFLADCGLR
jgi:hypothetical protein